jgi:hypothetical protein
MIPNLAIMICAYIVFRCIEAIVKVFREGRSAGGIVIVLTARACICMALLATFAIISSGASAPNLPR